MREAQKSRGLLFLFLLAAGVVALGFGLLGHSLPADSDHPAGPAGVAMHPRPPVVAVVAAAAGAAASVKERGRCDNDVSSPRISKRCAHAGPNPNLAPTATRALLPERLSQRTTAAVSQRYHGGFTASQRCRSGITAASHW